MTFYYKNLLYLSGIEHWSLLYTLKGCERLWKYVSHTTAANLDAYGRHARDKLLYNRRFMNKYLRSDQARRTHACHTLFCCMHTGSVAPNSLTSGKQTLTVLDYEFEHC